MAPAILAPFWASQGLAAASASARASARSFGPSSRQYLARACASARSRAARADCAARLASCRSRFSSTVRVSSCCRRSLGSSARVAGPKAAALASAASVALLLAMVRLLTLWPRRGPSPRRGIGRSPIKPTGRLGLSNPLCLSHDTLMTRKLLTTRLGMSELPQRSSP